MHIDYVRKQGERRGGRGEEEERERGREREERSEREREPPSSVYSGADKTLILLFVI